MPDTPVMAPCLVVDDEADIRELLVLTLERMGLDVESAASVTEAQQKLARREFALCLTDMRLPDGDGLELMRHIFQQRPGMPVAVITAYGSAENAVAALKAGAFDYLSKPISLKQLRPLVQSALKLSVKAEMKPQGPGLIGDSSPIRHARLMIDKLARSQAPVYISGESGSGKELAARLIHASSVRRDGPFIPVNCGAIPESLMESEFFGYKKGAFTGALQDREGFFHAANMVGSTQEENVDVRIISATHRNLSQLMESGQFRQDLYYRLNVIELKMPPLREMAEDIPQLAQNILARHCSELAVPVPVLSKEAAAALARHSFPGNVRELENVLERALALCNGSTIERDDLLLESSGAAFAEEDGYVADGELALPEYLESVERKIMLDALHRSPGAPLPGRPILRDDLGL